MARILIGTSGWHYESWRGPFFPKGLLLKDQLQYYASQFATTELNGVFYRTPTPAAVKGWRQQTGDDFRLRLEGIQIHHPLETPVGKIRQQPRTARRPAFPAR